MEVIVCSEIMRKLMAMVERVARGSAAVLITGETGSGKELIARAIHHHSLRATKPWVDVNCAALPEHLVESELFGYEKGAFSGADTPKQGLFELADKGTLFLDEIGELEPKVQVKLLRVLDGVPYYRLGGHRKVAVDVRIVAATNQPLEEAVREGRFRSDLFHRLSQIQLRVPPLRDRPEDVVAIAQYFLEQSHPGTRFSCEAMEVLRSYSWPGNIRELRNVIMQSSTLALGDEVRPSDLPAELAAARPITQSSAPAGEAVPAASLQEGVALDELEKQAILRALTRAGGHQGVAAEQLGISRRTLSRKLKQYYLEARQTDRRALGTLAGSEKVYFRATAQIPVSISTRTGQQYTAMANNVSGGGMALDGVKEPFQLAGGFKMSFTLPGVDHATELNADIVWADVQGKAGVRFLDLSPETEAFLKNWLLQKQAEEGWAVVEVEASSQ